LLVVSELVTNALRHGGGTCTLDLTAHPDTIEVAVHDSSPQAPRMRTPDLNGDTGGFGWPMVNRLARTTSVTLGPSGGKTVRALLPRSHDRIAPHRPATAGWWPAVQNSRTARHQPKPARSAQPTR
ncbi:MULTISPECIES: ATP-binding protein, partial [unclassified Streptomyces]|uniref:ATP-binding protein n=1 Tax=unclassified Streptomyces TaxID=2593676 RepID=UPI000B508D2E